MKTCFRHSFLRFAYQMMVELDVGTDVAFDHSGNTTFNTRESIKP
jgi:hypothetical protein